MFQTLRAVFKEKFYKKVFTIFVLVFSFLYFLFTNFSSSVQAFDISFFSFSEKLKLFLASLFDISQLKSLPMFLLVIFFILSLSLFFTLITALYRKTGEISKGRSFWATLSIFISVLGLSCAACGIGLLASLLSFLGLSWLVAYLPMQGLELGFLGVIALNISNYILLKRLKNPFTC